MLLSAVSVLVVAQSISEIPEGLMNNPVHYSCIDCVLEDLDSAVGITTRYGLYGPGIESQWGANFPHLSRLALGLSQHPVQ